MIRIYFRTLDLAVQYAQAHGGWIAQCDDGSAQWFDASAFTLTPIMRAVRGNARIGPWTMFVSASPQC